MLKIWIGSILTIVILTAVVLLPKQIACTIESAGKVLPVREWMLIQEDDGVLMVDKVQYIPPFGILGRIANALIIRPKLEEIFDHRFKKMAELYG